MSDWQRRPGLACEFCGGPGHLIPIPVPISALVCVDDPIAPPMPTPTRIACPEHRFLVLQRAEREQDPDYYAYRHGRPAGWGETDPERTRQALLHILEVLDDLGDPRAAEIRRKAEQNGLI